MKRTTTPATLCLLLGLLGCDAGKVDETHEGRLEKGDLVLAQDGSLYDSFGFEADKGAQITLDLASEDFDAFVHLMDADSEQIAYNDDAGPGSTDARIVFEADRTGVYYAVVNTRTGDSQGAYVLHIKVEPEPAK